MRSIRNSLIVLAAISLVLSCNLFSGKVERDNEADRQGESAGGGRTSSETDGNKERGPEELGAKTVEAKKDASTVYLVRFAKGQNSRSYSNSIAKGGSNIYKLTASKGQKLEAEIAAKKNNAEMKVFDPGGQPLRNDGSPTFFTSPLPASGTYEIVVTSESGDDSFVLRFSVTGNANDAPDADMTVGLTKTVRFFKGRSSASYKDAAVRGTRNNYVLGANAGQVMSVNITSIEDNAVFQIKGPSGYLPGAGPGSDRKSWSGELPVDGKYTVIVGSTRGNATYTVGFSIK